MSNNVVRLLTVETMQTDITAKELAQLLSLEVTYTERAMDAMTHDERSLVERNSRAVA